MRYLAGTRTQPFKFYSCFITYSHVDRAFARRLHDALQGRGIRCWLDEHQLRPGDLIHRAVDEGIRLWDKVLLCASEAALTSWWVDKEIRKALSKEEELWKERNKEVLSLIPLNLDGFMFKPQWVDWKREHLTARLAADFTGWENDNAKFKAQFERVVKALRADAKARPPAPQVPAVAKRMAKPSQLRRTPKTLAVLCGSAGCGKFAARKRALFIPWRRGREYA